jgi:signal transduction histidine kinase
MPLEFAPPASKVRWLFLAVCGALLALLAASGIVAIRDLRKMHDQELAVRHGFAERAQMLSDLSLSIQNYSLSVQNYNQAVQQFTAEARADRDQPAQQRLDQLTLEIDSDLKRYPVERDASEAALLDGLQDVFLQQRTVYISVRAGRPEERRRGQSVAADPMASLQKKVLDWSAKLQTWNGDRLKDADQAMVNEFASLQYGLRQALAIGFGSGFLLVLVGMAYIARIERQTRHRYTQLAQSQHQLQQLSARLLDAQEMERRSISRELHDEVGQSLGALLVDLGRLSTALSSENPALKAQLENMRSVAERTFQAVRDISLLLRPSMLDDLGLVAALEWQGREVSRRSEMEVEVHSENVSDSLPEEYRICVYRLVQEALNNAVRHSGAKNAKVNVSQTPRSLILRVSDDGRGFDAQRMRGLGLLGMEERVKRLAGKLTVESKPGQGATLTAELPFPPVDGVIHDDDRTS